MRKKSWNQLGNSDNDGSILYRDDDDDEMEDEGKQNFVFPFPFFIRAP